MSDIEIKQLLENLEVQPSPRCWDAIESGIASTGSAAGGTAAAAKAAGHAARHLSSAAVKGIIVGGATTFVAAALVTALLLSSPSEPTTPSSNPTAEASAVTPESETIATLPDTTDNNTPAVSHHSSITATENPTENPQTETPVAATTTEITTPPEPAANSAPVHANSASTALLQQSNTQATTNTTKNPAPKTNTSHPVSTPQPVAQTEDPVLAGRDDLDFTPPVTIEIPNVITPNGDGYNDLFIIKGIENCEKSKLIVRSRGGSVVLQVSDYQNNWDAQNAPDGTYYYQLYYTIHGIEEVRTGTLTIIR